MGLQRHTRDSIHFVEGGHDSSHQSLCSLSQSTSSLLVRVRVHYCGGDRCRSGSIATYCAQGIGVTSSVHTRVFAVVAPYLGNCHHDGAHPRSFHLPLSLLRLVILSTSQTLALLEHRNPTIDHTAFPLSKYSFFDADSFVAFSSLQAALLSAMFLTLPRPLFLPPPFWRLRLHHGQ